MQTITHRFRYAVPSQGVLIYSESDFDDPEVGIEAMSRAFEEGAISDWQYWKITITTEEELIMEQHYEN